MFSYRYLDTLEWFPKDIWTPWNGFLTIFGHLETVSYGYLDTLKFFRHIFGHTLEWFTTDIWTPWNGFLQIFGHTLEWFPTDNWTTWNDFLQIFRHLGMISYIYLDTPWNCKRMKHYTYHRSEPSSPIINITEKTLLVILSYLSMEYWKITVAIFPSRQSVFPSEFLKLPWPSPLLVNTRKYFKLTESIQEYIG